MGFADKQLRRLQAPLKPQHIKSREAEGITLHYLEGWHVLAEANRIFGFDGWDREMVACQCVWTKQLANRFTAAYVARVRITVRAGETPIIREGSGAGEATVPDARRSPCAGRQGRRDRCYQEGTLDLRQCLRPLPLQGQPRAVTESTQSIERVIGNPRADCDSLKAIAGELRFRAGRPQAIAVRGQKRAAQGRNPGGCATRTT